MRWLNLKLRMSMIGSSLSLRFGFLVLLIIGFTGCWYPLFNLDVAIGEQLVWKLGAPKFVFLGSHNLYFNDQFTFIPIKVPEPTQGLAISERNVREQFIWEIVNSTNLQSSRLEIMGVTLGPQVFPVTFDNAVGSEPIVYFPIKVIDQINVGFRSFFDSTAQTLSSDPNYPRVAVGIIIEPDISLNTTKGISLLVLEHDANPLNPRLLLKEEWIQPADLPTQAVFSGPELSLLYDQNIMGVVKSGFIGKYPTNVLSGFTQSYLFSGRMVDGSIKTFAWFSNGDFIGLQPTLLSEVTNQISFILSSGELLSISDDQLIIYSPLGESRFLINTGNIKFVHERYDSIADRWYSVFTRNVRSEDQLLLEVFEFPTSRLRELASR